MSADVICETTLERMAKAFHGRYTGGPYSEYDAILTETSMRRAIEVLRADLGPFSDKEWWQGTALEDRFDEIMQSEAV